MSISLKLSLPLKEGRKSILFQQIEGEVVEKSNCGISLHGLITTKALTQNRLLRTVSGYEDTEQLIAIGRETVSFSLQLGGFLSIFNVFSYAQPSV